MANLNVSADLINEFVISNFTPYAWSNMWETTEVVRYGSNKGSYKFLMMIRPNIIERQEFHEPSGQIMKLRSSNSGYNLPAEYYSGYCIEIPMVCGDAVTKNGKTINQDSIMKHRYIRQMKRYIWFGIGNLHGIAQPMCDEGSLFGSHYSKVKSWLDGDSRSEWGFLI